MKKLLLSLASAALVATAWAIPDATAGSVEDFYKGRTVRVMIGYSAGGGYDAYARLVSRHMARFIPGKPKMVAMNKTGGGSAVLASWLANVAPRDGSVIATIGNAMPLTQILWPKRAKADTGKFFWIGNANEGNNVVEIWHTKGITSWEQLKTTEVIVGGTSARSISVIMPRALNSILGTKFRIITGFRGGARINMAMERGEVDGRGSNAWASIKGTTPHYLEKNLITIPLQVGYKRDPELADVPLLTELAPNEAGRIIFQTLTALIRIGRPILTTPGVPADRVAALRAAFDAAMASKEYKAEVKKRKLDYNPVSGVKVQQAVRDILNTPKEVVELMRAAVTKGKTYKCTAVVKDKKLCRSKKKKKKKKKSS